MLEDKATKLECYSRFNSASTTGYGLPEPLEFFNRMSIAAFDRLITDLPIQEIDILERRLEQNVGLSMRRFRERNPIPVRPPPRRLIPCCNRRLDQLAHALHVVRE